MLVLKNALMLRIFVGQDHHYASRPLYEAIVLKARELHLAGATVLRGPLGFGQSGRVHKTRTLSLADDLPMVIEIVDIEEKVNAFLPILDGMVESGLVTIEKVQVLHPQINLAQTREPGRTLRR
ncbi:MAG: DUF190 domain-containing protein [Proteobacteria bacterium]|nr:DUF190 domain-containing protein [Pseudomonadota bacterium]